jgi:C-terminal processing protease CtpA/Prc
MEIGMRNRGINPAEIPGIVQTLSKILLDSYVFPDIAEEICTRLADHLDNGNYHQISDGVTLASALTIHLQEVNQDEHLRVRWVPEPLSDDGGSMLQNKERLVDFREKAKLDNYGIHKVERLPGNIGLIDIRYFYRPSWGSGDTAVSAMCMLGNMNALIFDLRQCRGGNPGMVALISTYLFDGEPIHLNSLFWREEDFTQQYWTLPYVPGKRFGELPVFVLISKATFSAGEEFSYNLKSLQRATLVGETTGGGAHPGSPFRLHPHFEVFIPLGRAINPITKENWEGWGVTPDIPVESNLALGVAYKLALKTTLNNLESSDSVPQEQLLEEIRTALKGLDQTFSECDS